MWIIKAFGFALVTTLLLIAVDMIPFGNSKATGISVFRARGVFLMYVGIFQVILGLLLSRIEMVSDGGRMHFTLR